MVVFSSAAVASVAEATSRNAFWVTASPVGVVAIRPPAEDAHSVGHADHLVEIAVDHDHGEATPRQPVDHRVHVLLDAEVDAARLSGAALVIASAASYLTGADLPVDGGRLVGAVTA